MDVSINYIKENALNIMSSLNELCAWMYSIYLMMWAYFIPEPVPVTIIETIKKPTYEILYHEMSNIKHYYDIDDLKHDMVNSSVVMICIIIAGFWCIDHCLRKRITDTTARWYILHCIANAFVVWFAFDNVCHLVSNPDTVINITPTYSPLNVTIALHMYHMLFFNNLVMIDWVHHILMISIAMISYCYSAPIIVVTNGLLMFLNGLPGGIDYFLLTLVKMKFMNKMSEKYINVYLNLCIRSPGVIVATYILYLTFQKTQEVDWYMQCVVYGILLWNSQYFLLRVIGNFVACLFNQKYNVNNIGNVKSTPKIVREALV